MKITSGIPGSGKPLEKLVKNTQLKTIHYLANVPGLSNGRQSECFGRILFSIFNLCLYSINLILSSFNVLNVSFTINLFLSLKTLQVSRICWMNLLETKWCFYIFVIYVSICLFYFCLDVQLLHSFFGYELSFVLQLIDRIKHVFHDLQILNSVIKEFKLINSGFVIVQFAADGFEGAPGSPVSSSTLPFDLSQTIGYNSFVLLNCMKLWIVDCDFFNFFDKIHWLGR